MITKCIEIRDEGTCIAALAIKMVGANEIEHVFLWREGYPLDGSGVVLMRMSDQQASSDPYQFSSRTMQAAHLHILERWDDLKDGDVVDVRVCLGISQKTAEPEIWRHGVDA